MMHYLIKFLGWPFGLRFAPYNYVKPVLRWGQFHRWGRGFFWIIPFVEQTRADIDTGMHKKPLNLSVVMSQDNIPFEFRLTVLFIFQPDRKTPGKELATQLIYLSEETKLEMALNSMIEDHLSDKLRDLVSAIKAEDVYRASNRIRIKRDLIHSLEVRLHDWGVTLIGEKVLIREIIAPEKFQRTMLEAEQHEVILRALNAYKDQPELIDKAVQAEFLDNLEDRKVDLRIGTLLDLDYLRHPRKEEGD
jgi:regulator of protease activity HflC (stomatin/prohibitin superfamily)